MIKFLFCHELNTTQITKIITLVTLFLLFSIILIIHRWHIDFFPPKPVTYYYFICQNSELIFGHILVSSRFIFINSIQRWMWMKMRYVLLMVMMVNNFPPQSSSLSTFIQSNYHWLFGRPLCCVFVYAVCRRQTNQRRKCQCFLAFLSEPIN